MPVPRFFRRPGELTFRPAYKPHPKTVTGAVDRAIGLYTLGGTTMDGHNSLLNLANRSGTFPRGIIVGQVRIRRNADLRASIGV